MQSSEIGPNGQNIPTTHAAASKTEFANKFVANEALGKQQSYLGTDGNAISNDLATQPGTSQASMTGHNFHSSMDNMQNQVFKTPTKRSGYGVRKSSKSAAREQRPHKKGGRLHKALNGYMAASTQMEGSRQTGKSIVLTS